MNTIERVARGISMAFVKDKWPEMTTEEQGWEAENRTEFHMSEAKAALEALCEGLEWRDVHVYYNGAFIGGVVKQPYGKWGWWGIWAKPINGPLHTEGKAREALMQAARNWIMGVESVAEKG